MGSEALASLLQATKLSRSKRILSSLAHAQARFGQPAQARQTLATMNGDSRKVYIPSYYFALIHAGLGENDHAFEWLERAFRERSTVLTYLRLDARFAPLRSDPRYADLVRRIGFPSSS
jgi:serine/threonine-protein kinase